ncbi:helix-turn-helix transcriptional regulator [Paenibacillus lautus]|uniref:helix-turn-helix transcriptional regulator n=1 Tax=Paenibacillus lautus TaxID=1401 RepID=UPI003D2BB2B3
MPIRIRGPDPSSFLIEMVYSIQGRGGGYRLLNESILPPITFTESEAIAIFFASQSLRYFGALPFGDQAKSALDKFYHNLPSDAREQINRLQNKVAIWSTHRSMSVSCLIVLLEAIMKKSAVTIGYNSGKNVLNTREIQPIGLYSDRGYWYCPAYCFTRQAYRLFRADRIMTVSMNDNVSYPEDVDSKTVFNWDVDKLEGQEKTLFCAYLTQKGKRKLEENGRSKDFIESLDDGGGVIRMHIPANKLEFYTDMI